MDRTVEVAVAAEEAEETGESTRLLESMPEVRRLAAAHLPGSCIPETYNPLFLNLVGLPRPYKNRGGKVDCFFIQYKI